MAANKPLPRIKLILQIVGCLGVGSHGIICFGGYVAGGRGDGGRDDELAGSDHHRFSR